MYTADAPTISTVSDPAFATFRVDPSGLHLVGTASVAIVMPVIR